VDGYLDTAQIATNKRGWKKS